MEFRIKYNTVWGESLCLRLAGRNYPMQWNEGNVWSVTVKGVKAADLLAYGYAVVRDGVICRTEWEDHSAKLSKLVEDAWLDCPIEGCAFARKHSVAMFDEPGFRGAGTAVPVFSLRSEQGFGIGEFADLKPLIDWAAQTGQCIIQLLPVNDTTRKGLWEDSYPYSPVSSFALHPLYIRLQDAGVPQTDEFCNARTSINRLKTLDYPRVFKEKMAYLQQAYAAKGAGDLASAGFKKFYRENIEWLGEYCEFCAQRDNAPTEFYAWVQYHLDKQFSDVVAYAHSRGVCLKGDLPIGVSADSADAYYHPELFNLDSSAGAPPDFFSTDGQNWGFPTYNWDEMAKDGYAWWKARLRKMSQYFDAFRIDHILGFFRIWEIPTEFKSGLQGHFNPALPYSADEIASAGLPVEGLFHEDPRHPGMYQPLISPDKSALEEWQKQNFDALYSDFYYHRHDAFWKRNAERKLPELLTATGMLACGEDLGMVPDCVSGVMEHERILSLEMSMMDKGRPWPYLSVCATSSHDMATVRMQQVEDPEPWECKQILWSYLESASMLAVFPLQDWLALDGKVRLKDRMAERINCPENPHHHWRYRMHIGVEKLASCKGMNLDIEGLLKDSGRYRWR